MKVGVVVAGEIVPAWQHASVRALRALGGVTVTVAAARAAQPRAPFAARFAGAALAREPIACDGPLPSDADVVLDLTGAEPVTQPPGGVWRFRFGTDDGTAGIPFVREIAGGANAVGIELVRHTDAREETLRSGRFPVTRWHPSTLRTALFEAAAWPALAVAALRDGVQLPVAPSTAAAARGATSARERLRFAGALARHLWNYASETLLETVEWNVGFVTGDARVLLGSAPLDVRWMPRPAPRTFIADPFLVERDGRRVLLVEDYDYARDRGVIDALELGPDNTVVHREHIIDGPAHVSYPYPVEIDGDLYLVPESSAGGGLAMYRCVEFPFRWQHEPFTFPVCDAVDTTIFEHDGRWWALFTRASKDSTTALYAYHAASPRGPWTAHALNPIVVDVTSARPAGRPFEVDGALYRPGQDCSRSYGGGLAIARIDELSPTAYRETVVRRIDAHGFGRYCDGVHTVSFAAGAVAIDGKHVARDLRQAAWLLARAATSVARHLLRANKVTRSTVPPVLR